MRPFFSIITFNKLPTSNWRGVLDKGFIKNRRVFERAGLGPKQHTCTSAKVPYQAASHIEVSSSIVIKWFKLWESCKSSSPPLLCYCKVSQAHIFLMPSWPSKVSKNEKLWKANIYESLMNHLAPSTSLRQSNIIMRWFHRVIPEIRCKTLCKSIITIMSIHSSYSNCCLNLIGLKAISI